MPWRRGTRSFRRGTSTSRTRCRWSPTTRRSSTSKRLGNIPLRLGKNVYLRDVATIQDDTDITYGYALVNGKKSVYLPIIKKDTGSTLTVVADVHKSMQMFRDAVPKDVKVSFEFDESPTVVAAVESVATEGLIGAGLTGLMILLFLRDLRSVIVVVSNIPLALLGSLFGLWVTGNTINIMSLGGMALAIGILVDEATVTIENMHVQMGHTPNDRHGRAARAATPRPCRGCWPCSASCRCSSRRSSWTTRSGRCSCR